MGFHRSGLTCSRRAMSHPLLHEPWRRRQRDSKGIPWYRECQVEGDAETPRTGAGIGRELAERKSLAAKNHGHGLVAWP